MKGQAEVSGLLTCGRNRAYVRAAINGELRVPLPAGDGGKNML
jgi:hypothetical protein